MHRSRHPALCHQLHQPLISAATAGSWKEPYSNLLENMEVLVTRQARRLSRLLLVVLLVSFSGAALSFIYKMNHQPAPAGAAPIAVPAAPIATNNSPPSPLTPSPLSSGSFAPAPLSSTTQPAPQIAPPLSPLAPQVTTEPPHAQPAGWTSTTEPSVSATSLLADAQAKIDNGHFLEARGELNDALQSGTLNDCASRFGQSTACADQPDRRLRPAPFPR